MRQTGQRTFNLIVGAALLLAATMLGGCAAAPGIYGSGEGKTITWSGRVYVERTLKLARDVHLVIEPGTTVVFAFVDDDADGLGDVSLNLEGGTLTALGTVEKPVTFTSEQSAAPGNWGEIRIDFGTIALANTVIEGSTRGLHLHFVSGSVENSVFRLNVDGTRIGESRLTVKNCLFSQNSGKGFNARSSNNTVTGNLFRMNRRGIFLFEGDEGSTISGNIFTGNETPFRLGDFYAGTVTVSGNRWDDAPDDYRAEGNDEAHLVTAPAPVREAGPVGWPLLTPAWAHEMKPSAAQNYVDADPAADETGVFAADWSGKVVRLGLISGNVVAEAELGDIVDAGPALTRINGQALLAVQGWDRNVTLMNGSTLTVLDTFIESPSPADDHRQSAPVFYGSTLYAATWAGNLHAFSVTGNRLQKLWTYQLGAPVRADLTVSGATLYVATEAGALLAFDSGYRGGEPKPLWKTQLVSPLLGKPLAHDGKVFVGDKGSILWALTAAEGKVLWQQELCSGAWYGGAMWLEGAAADTSALVQGDDAGCMAAFTPGGALAWRTMLDGGVRAAPAPVAGALAAVTLGGSLWLLDPVDGRTLDRLSFDAPVHTSPAVLGQRLFIGGRDGVLKAYDVRTRKP